MKLFEVYPLFDVEPVEADGALLFDRQGTNILIFTVVMLSFLLGTDIHILWRELQIN